MKYPIGTKLIVCCIPNLDIPVEVTVKSIEYITEDNSYVYVLSNGIFIDEDRLEEILYKPKDVKESKAQQYIWDYTKNCSNQLLFEDDNRKYYEPWLTPDHALSAIQIAKEEFIERAAEWFDKNITHKTDKGVIINFDNYSDLINNFKKYVEV